MPEYLMILLGFIAFTFLLQKKEKIKLFDSRKQMLIYYFILYAFGIAWDTLAVYRGHWTYGNGMLGINIGLVPLEDYLFIFTCSYFGLVLYKIVSKKI